MAELLVKAKSHWMDSLNQTEINKMDKEKRQHYTARSQIGDIIVVRPDGWKWGREECLPNYVVVKVPGLSTDIAKKYEESLTEEYIDELGETQLRTLKTRKYRLLDAVVDNAKLQSKSTISIDKTSLNVVGKIK